MWALYNAIFFLLFRCSKAAESPFGLDLAPVEPSASMLWSVVNLFSFSMPPLEALLSPSFDGSGEETFYLMIHTMQQEKPVPEELMKALIKHITGTAFENPKSLFFFCRSWMYYNLDPLLRLDLNWNGIVWDFFTILNNANSVEHCFQYLGIKYLHNVMFIEVPSVHPGISDPPVNLSIAGKKFALSGIVTEYKLEGVKKYYTQYIGRRCTYERIKEGESFSFSNKWDAQNGMADSLGSRPCLIAYMEWETSKTFALPPISTINKLPEGGHL
jgi:hypothetical protein